MVNHSSQFDFLKLNSFYKLIIIAKLIVLFSLKGICQLQGTFHIETLKLENWPLIHSFSYAKYHQYVIMLGGRRWCAS